MRTIEIELAVARYFDPRKNLIVPNVSWGLVSHECDLLILRKSGYTIEVEIKISLADLKKDLKKLHKHDCNMIKQLYFAIPAELIEKGLKYIPSNAGILLCEKHGINEVWVRTYRSPENNKNARKLTEKEKFQMARLGTLRIWNLKEKLI